MTGCCGVGISIVRACGRAPGEGKLRTGRKYMLERVEEVRGREPTCVRGWPV